MKRQNKLPSSRLPGFYNLPIAERHDRLSEIVPLTAEERYQLLHEILSPSIADHMVENVIGVFGLPLGLAVNFRINARDYVIPMAVEESSVIAAASHVAKLVREHGRLTTESTDPVMIGQVQIVGTQDAEQAKTRILESKKRLLQIANEQDPVLVDLGGGAKEVDVRVLETIRGPMVIVHLHVNVCDAMGANVVNTMCEALGHYIEGITGGKVVLRILSNLATERLARARLEVSPSAFDARDWHGAEVVEGLLDAYAFALADPFRAATHNKGVLNGIDGVVIATGNDWRAVEAGAHAYAARDGQYKPLTHWKKSKDGKLIGEIEIPMPLGLVGGATKVHPVANLVLKIMGVRSANELAEVTAAAGLVQNLAAMRSLVTEGIQKGHMILHAKNVAISAGAMGDTVSHVANQMIREGKIGFHRAKDILRVVLREAERKVHNLETRIRGDRASLENPSHKDEADPTP